MTDVNGWLELWNRTYIPAPRVGVLLHEVFVTFCDSEQKLPPAVDIDCQLFTASCTYHAQ